MADQTVTTKAVAMNVLLLGGDPMKRKNMARRWLSLLRPQLPAFMGGILCVLVVASVELTIPLVFGRGIIDEALAGMGNPSQLTFFAIGAVVLFIAKGLFTYGAVYLTSYVGNRTSHNLRSSVFSHVIRLPVSFFTRQGNGDVIARATNDIAVIQNAISSGTVNAIRNVVLLVGIMIAIFVLNWKLSLVTILVMPLAALTIGIFGRRIRLQSRTLNEKIGALTSIMSETLRGIRIVKAFTMESTQKERFTQQNESGFEASMKSVHATATMTPIVEILIVCAMVLVIWVGGMEVLAGRITLGALVAFLAYVGMVTQPVTSLSQIWGLVQQAAAASERVFQLLEAETEVRENAKAGKLAPVTGHIRFKDVTFAYEPGKQVLQNVNLEIKPGETIALVGPSGAGKSTIAGLIPRFYDPTQGTVEIDGQDIRGVTLDSLRSQIGLVSQETVLFQVSVAENITAGRRGYSREEIEAAARMANAHEFIMDLPNGYDTVVGEGGCTLSGGQRQRIAIARALIGNPRVLVLDEATSNLDAESEHLVKEALERLAVGRTTVIIAHRAATVQSADRVIVVSKGRIVQEGRHHELSAVNGLYRRLFGSLEPDLDWQNAQVTG